MIVLATYSIKGGVGKTTSAVNLAHEAAEHGARTLLWDLDPQGAATFLVRTRPGVEGGAERLIGDPERLVASIRATDDSGLHVLPADFSLRHLDLYLADAKRPKARLAALLEPLRDRYDVVLLDCAPGITLTSESVFRAADALLVPTIPTPLSDQTLHQLGRFLADLGDRPGVLPFATMFDRRKSLHRVTVARLAAQEPGFLPTVIPTASAIERMGLHRAPVARFAPTDPAAVAYRDLWADVAARVWAGG